ncbi:hypothetical protein CO670_15325 [Rhizobium sp. J15]|nr:hypothetical protein CO670_15325 [Rhizobium sp. J15]
MRCDLKSLGECPVPCATQCGVLPVDAKEPPQHRFTARDQLILVATGLAVYACVFFAMSAWNEQLRVAKADCQEACYVAR